MFGVDWSDPQTLWLNLTNLALGIVVILAVLVVAGAVGQELLARHRKAREAGNLDAELRSMASAGSAHVLPVPELGLTMADGGEPLPAPEAKAAKKRQRK